MSNLGVLTEEPVYIGVWTNWSHGKVFGSTLTLTQRDANFLVAFIALFVSYVGTCFFRVTSFALHTYFSSPVIENDAIYHQRQAVLRNSATGTDALWSFSQISWYWRRHGFQATKRVAMFFLHALICVTVFAVAGIFSSRIANLSGDEVLLSSSKCAIIGSENNVTLQDIFRIHIPHAAQRASAFLDYVQNCYAVNSTKPACQGFVKPRLSYTVDRNASCPFAEEMCRSSTANIRLDSGYLDSHWDLGLNTPPSRRMKLRQVLHCSPLNYEDYTASVNYTVNGTVIPYRRYFYGDRLGAFGEIAANYSYTIQEVSPNQTHYEHQWSEQIYYGVGYSTFYGSNSDQVPNSYFQPIAPLYRNDSDIHILHIGARKVLYANPVDDPWFSAHKPNGALSDADGSAKVYNADEAAPALGCTSQYELCLPNGNCSLPTSLGDALEFGDSVNRFEELSHWVTHASPFGNVDLSMLISSLGGTFLLANHGLQQGMQYDLPDNQWQIETERLFQIILASMQIAFVDTATGSSIQGIEKLTTPPENEVEKSLCRNQKIRSNAYANFSVFGLGFSLGMGLLIIFLNWTSEWIYETWLSTKRRPLPYAQMEWTLNGTLQLQRLAHEGIGYGAWSQCDKDVPTTELYDMLAGLELQNTKHPRLQHIVPDHARSSASGAFAPFEVSHSSTMETIVEKPRNAPTEHCDASRARLSVEQYRQHIVSPSVYSISPIDGSGDWTDQAGIRK